MKVSFTLSAMFILNVCISVTSPFLYLRRDWCGPVVSVLVRSRYIAYSEGWALYAENPLVAKETGRIGYIFNFLSVNRVPQSDFELP